MATKTTTKNRRLLGRPACPRGSQNRSDAGFRPKSGSAKSVQVADRRRELRTELPTGLTPEQVIASRVMGGTIQNALLTANYLGTEIDDLGLTECFIALHASTARVQAGDLSEPESLLMGQAVALQGVFTRLAQAALATLTKHGNLDGHERLLRLALKAQSQSRAALETLGGLVNPPHSAVFAKQANIAHGPQQVNNGIPPTATGSRARVEPVSAPTELLEAHDQPKRLDAGAPGSAGAAHQQLEAVGVVNRPAKP